MMGVFVQVNEKSNLARKYPVGYVIQENGCWDWVGYVCPNGYGRWTIDGKTALAHTNLYKKLVGPIPPGLHADHLCRNRRCVNPAHMELVTFRENVMRGISFAVENSKKTHCPRGHPYDKTWKGRAGRFCSICSRETKRRYADKPEKRAAKNKLASERQRFLCRGGTREQWKNRHRVSGITCAPLPPV